MDIKVCGKFKKKNMGDYKSFAYERHMAHIHMIIKLFPCFCMSGITAATTAVTLPMGNHLDLKFSCCGDSTTTVVPYLFYATDRFNVR